MHELRRALQRLQGESHREILDQQRDRQQGQAIRDHYHPSLQDSRLRSPNHQLRTHSDKEANLDALRCLLELQSLRAEVLQGKMVLLSASPKGGKGTRLTLRLSTMQAELFNFLKIPNNTPEDFAKMKHIDPSTASVHLSRIRRKDREARIFHAMINGSMAGNPNLKLWLKVHEEGLSAGEQKELDRRLQNLTALQIPVRKHARNIRAKQQDSTGSKRAGSAKRRPVKS